MATFYVSHEITPHTVNLNLNLQIFMKVNSVKGKYIKLKLNYNFTCNLIHAMGPLLLFWC